MRAMAMIVAVSVFSTARGATPNYLPLAEGNQWTFTTSLGGQTTTQVVGFAEVGTVPCAILETTLGQQKSREYVAADSEGVKLYLSQTQGQEYRYDPPVLRIKLPYKEGDLWTATAKQAGRTITTSFQSIGKDRVQTPAGTFDCIKVYSVMNGIPGQPSPISIDYYADGVGLVRREMRVGGQQMVTALASVNIQPVQKPPAAKKPRTAAQPAQETQTASKTPTAGKTRCPKCGAAVEAAAKFCPECGQSMTTSIPAPEPNRPAAAAPAGSAPLEKYQSPDGKVVLYKPKDWNTAAQSEMFGPNTYGVTVLEPQENAAVLFITFPAGPGIKDSVALAAQCITALRARYLDLQATNSNSTPGRERTVTDLALTAEGQKGIGHGYFFLTQNVGSVYILLAKARMWNALRPTLTTIAANLAYAPQGVAAVQKEGRQATTQVPAAEGSIPPLAAMLRQAAQQPGKQIPLQPAALTDQSVSLQIPQGWTLEGQRVQYAVVDDPQKRAYGLGSLWRTIIPMQTPVPGTITASYQPPAQALKLMLEFGKSTRDVQTIGECPVEQAVPEMSPLVQQLRAQGSQVDARLILAKFRNVPTGLTCRGLFSVMCSIKPGSPVWQVSVQGSWAPESEYEEWLPLYLRVEKTVQINQQWMSQEMQNQAIRQQQLNRNLQRSIAESNRAFDNYMSAVRDGERSRDYTSHMWSQTTLGQGTWVAQNEGAKVYQTDSWGIEGPEGRIDSKAYNTANFTGENPWTGGQLELVNTRAEYEKYIANK